MEGLLPDGEPVDGKKKSQTTPYKVIFVGDSSVGKTSIVNRYINDYFQQFNAMTLQCSFQSKMVDIPKTKRQVKLHIWDTAGDEKFRNIVKMYYRDAHVVVLWYDITSEDSFDNLKRWIDEIEENLDKHKIKVVLCGCKCDLDDIREVQTKEGMRLAKEHNFTLFETSAKQDTGVAYMFTEIAKMLDADPPKAPRKDTVVLKSQTDEKETKSFFSKVFSFC